MYFAEKGHRDRFLTIIKEMRKIYDGKVDEEYGACLYILTSDPGFWEQTKAYVQGPPDTRIFMKKLIHEQYLSHGYDALMRLASNLFDGGQHVDPIVLIDTLDENNWQIAQTAMRIRRRMLPIEDFQD